MIRIFIVEEVGIQVDKATILYAIGQKEEALSLLKTTINIRLANYENIKIYPILRAHFYLVKFYLQDKHYETCIKVATEGINLLNYKFIYIYTGDLNVTKATAAFATYHFRLQP